MCIVTKNLPLFSFVSQIICSKISIVRNVLPRILFSSKVAKLWKSLIMCMTGGALGILLSSNVWYTLWKKCSIKVKLLFNLRNLQPVEIQILVFPWVTFSMAICLKKGTRVRKLWSFPFMIVVQVAWIVAPVLPVYPQLIRILAARCGRGELNLLHPKQDDPSISSKKCPTTTIGFSTFLSFFFLPEFHCHIFLVMTFWKLNLA